MAVLNVSCIRFRYSQFLLGFSSPFSFRFVFFFFSANLTWFPNVVAVIRWQPLIIRCRSVLFYSASPYFNSFQRFTLMMLKCVEMMKWSTLDISFSKRVSHTHAIFHFSFVFSSSSVCHHIDNIHCAHQTISTDFPNPSYSRQNDARAHGKMYRKIFSFADQNLFASRTEWRIQRTKIRKKRLRFQQ